MAKQRVGRASYTSLSAAGWQFLTGPAGVAAFRVRGAIVEETARFAAGDGDDLGSHYREAVRAVERGEYETEEHLC